jgi:hypothetical protein
LTRRLLPFLPAVALVAVALWSLLAQRAEEARAATDAEWEAARAVVREGFRAGDVLRTAPHWADSARATMYDYPFNVAVAIEEEDLYFYDRLWILADAAYVDDALAQLPDQWVVEQQWETSPRTRVLLVDIPTPDHVLHDLVTELRDAVVVRDYGEHRETCTLWHNGGWHCGRVDNWLHVTPSEEEIGGSLRRCLYVGLPPAVLRLTWPDLELGSRVQGAIGNTMPAVRADRGGAIDFRIELDGVTVHERRFDKWDQRLFEFDLDTSGYAGRHDLTFVLWTEDFFDRWVGLYARVLR